MVHQLVALVQLPVHIRHMEQHFMTKRDIVKDLNIIVPFAHTQIQPQLLVQHSHRLVQVFQLVLTHPALSMQ